MAGLKLIQLVFHTVRDIHNGEIGVDVDFELSFNSILQGLSAAGTADTATLKLNVDNTIPYIDEFDPATVQGQCRPDFCQGVVDGGF